MDDKFLNYYKMELDHLRGLSREFAEEFPKIAGRLKLSDYECHDPYVERLMEGFAFLTARIHKKFDESYPKITESILTSVFPIAWAPIPSMGVVKIKPDMTATLMEQGINIPAGTQFACQTPSEQKTECTFSTAAGVTLWPIEISRVSYITRTLDQFDFSPEQNVKAAVSIKLKSVKDIPFSNLSIDKLPFFINSSDELAVSLIEHIMADNSGMLICSQGTTPQKDFMTSDNIDFFGFKKNQSMFPKSPKQYSGYRLLLEYFTQPAAFRFIELNSLQKTLRRCNSTEIELIILLKKRKDIFSKKVKRESFQLFCVPVSNIFKKRTDRIHLDNSYEFRVIPDRTRPKDFEVYSVNKVSGIDKNNREIVVFDEFYHNTNSTVDKMPNVFDVHRRTRNVNMKKTQRSSYIGTEVYMSFSGKEYFKRKEDIHQLGIEAWCTNRDLPLLISPNSGLVSRDTGLTAQFITAPSAPLTPLASYEKSWATIGYLNFTYFDLFTTSPSEALKTVKRALALYCPDSNEFGAQQIDGIVGVKTRSITRRFLKNGYIAFTSGLELSITFDEQVFSGMGCFLLGYILREFLTDNMNINTFIEVVILTSQRGELIRWKPQIGKQ